MSWDTIRVRQLVTRHSSLIESPNPALLGDAQITPELHIWRIAKEDFWFGWYWSLRADVR